MNQFVYFLRPIGHAGPIKIGTSWGPGARLIELMRWSPLPLEIVITIPGDEKLERAIHNRFANAHDHSEWFKATPGLLLFIDDLQRGIPPHDATDLTRPTGNVLGLTQAATRRINGTDNRKRRPVSPPKTEGAAA